MWRKPQSPLIRLSVVVRCRLQGQALRIAGRSSSPITVWSRCRRSFGGTSAASRAVQRRNDQTGPAPTTSTQPGPNGARTSSNQPGGSSTACREQTRTEAAAERRPRCLDRGARWIAAPSRAASRRPSRSPAMHSSSWNAARTRTIATPGDRTEIDEAGRYHVRLQESSFSNNKVSQHFFRIGFDGDLSRPNAERETRKG